MNTMSKLLGLHDAIIDATTYHRGQLDKAGKPYILHPLTVMLNPSLTTEEERIVAVLHDVIEDTDFPTDRLIDYGFVVRNAVLAMTKKPGQKYMEYLEQLRHNRLAVKVKLADIEHNSSEERLKVLDEDEAEFLRNKYKRAKEYLLSCRI